MPRMNEPIALVYFLHAEDTNLVKIGWTADLDRRFDQLQTACPHKLRLLGVHIGPRDVETIYHRDLAPYRQQGEWFFLTREMRRFVIAGLGQHSESKSYAMSFRFSKLNSPQTIADIDEQAADIEEWIEKATAFAGVPGSQRSWLDNVTIDVAGLFENGIAGLLPGQTNGEDQEWQG